MKAVPGIQGVSFAQLLKQPEAPFRAYIFSEHNWHDYQAYERIIRTKDFLLEEFFDCQQDPRSVKKNTTNGWLGYLSTASAWEQEGYETTVPLIRLRQAGI